MTRPRLVVTDLDGTFLSPDGTVTAVNARAVVRCHELGIPFVAATGRPRRWLAPVDSLPGLFGLAVVSNGAGIVDLNSGDFVQVWGLDVAVATTVITDLRGAIPGVTFGVESTDSFTCEPTAPASSRADPATILAAADQLLLGAPSPALKLLTFHPELDSSALNARVAPVVAGRLTTTHSTWGGLPGMVEISDPGVDKASAVAWLCRMLGIGPAEVAAYGDMPNDAALLHWAGRPHVVANAHPSLLDGRFPVIGSHEFSGVGTSVLDLLSC